MNSRLPRIIFIIVILLCLGHVIYYYPLLPDRVASHFGPSGRPDAWSSKQSFLGIYLFAVGVVALLFSGIGPLLRRTPSRMITLPNRDYWLAPERAEETIEFLSRQFFLVGSATLLLLLDIFHQSFRVHFGKASTLEHAMTSLMVYVGYSVLWSIRLIAKFKRKQ